LNAAKILRDCARFARVQYGSECVGPADLGVLLRATLTSLLVESGWTHRI